MIGIAAIEHGDLQKLGILYEELTGKPSDPKQMSLIYHAMQANSGYHIVGAKLGQTLVGSAMGIVCFDLVGTCQPFMVVENVVVSSTCRRQGIGQKLMEELEAIARTNDCDYMMFVSRSHRKEAHQFYESIGYQLDNVQGFRKKLQD